MPQLNSLLFLGSVNSWPACERLAAHNSIAIEKSILEIASSWPFSEKIISIFDSQVAFCYWLADINDITLVIIIIYPQP